MKFFISGDVVGSPGRNALKALLPELLNKEKIDFCIVNAENAAGGSGITPDLARDLFGYGIDVITTGDHVWKRKEIFEVIDAEPCLLRPANYPPDSPGQGSVVRRARSGAMVGVINIIGRVFMDSQACPFRAAEEEIKKIKKQTPIIFVDMHAEATSEKIAMGWHLDGHASCVFGTHTHVQTADERILPNGTAYITDLGMTGPHDSVIGREKDKVIRRFITYLPSRFAVASGDVRVCGILGEVDDKSGKALTIKRIAYPAKGS